MLLRQSFSALATLHPKADSHRGIQKKCKVYTSKLGPVGGSPEELEYQQSGIQGAHAVQSSTSGHFDEKLVDAGLKWMTGRVMEAH